MAKNKEIAFVYLSGLIQGIAVVAFPATSTVFTSPLKFNFSNTEYGSLFLPQALLSIIACLLSAKFTHKKTIKPIFFIGLILNLLSMALLGLSYLAINDQMIAYSMLLLATGALGCGFGLTVSCLNTFAALFYPKKIDKAVLYLNALLGVGTCLSPLLMALFINLSVPWMLSAILVLVFLLLLIFNPPLSVEEIKSEKKQSFSKFPKRFWFFPAFALIYGIVETVNGNWSTLYMTEILNANASFASYALTLFWAMITLGRIFFASIKNFFSDEFTFRLLPFVIACAFILIAFVPLTSDLVGILLFALAGFGCSALLPLIISFGSRAFPIFKTSIAGNLLAFYLIGYGIAAFGVGSLQDQEKLNLPNIFGISVVFALILGILSFIVIKILRKSCYR